MYHAKFQSCLCMRTSDMNSTLGHREVLTDINCNTTQHALQ